MAAAILAVLAAILVPLYGRARSGAKTKTCMENLRQVGLGFAMYGSDTNDRMPDRRDLKRSLPGGYRPWSTWPKTDPRAGWAAVVLSPYTSGPEIWGCPAIAGTAVSEAIQVVQSSGPGGAPTRYWLWGFDQADAKVAPENFWGKTPDEVAANLGARSALGGIELGSEPYFPSGAAGVDPSLTGVVPHDGGRHHLYLDGQVRWEKER